MHWEQNVTFRKVRFNRLKNEAERKRIFSLAQNSILCEGIRRQRSDLALNLLTLYKDDQGRLIQILDKLLDRDIHVLFKNPNINPFNVGSKKVNQTSNTTQQANSNSPSSAIRAQQRKSAASNTTGEPLTEIDSSGLDESEGENFDQKAWEAKFRCLNLKTTSKRISNGNAQHSIDYERMSLFVSSS